MIPPLLSRILVRSCCERCTGWDSRGDEVLAERLQAPLGPARNTWTGLLHCGDFQPGITWSKPAWLMADTMNPGDRSELDIGVTKGQWAGLARQTRLHGKIWARLATIPARRIGSSSQSASRSECESLCHVFNYFFAWSRILYIFTSLFSCWIWCYGARKGKMYFFIMSSLLLPNFEGKEKVWNSRKSAYLWCIFLKRLARYFLSKTLIQKLL